MDQLIAAKLFRPKPAVDFVQRDELFEKLNKGADCNVTLVSAPAGYGKSVTISGWLEKSERPSAWVSFSKDDNDFTTFTRYFLNAIESLVPGLCNKTHTIIKNSPSLSAETVAQQLILDLQSLHQEVVVVLDDVGFLRKSSIFILLDQLVLHCPQNLQLVLITRRDPPLSIYKLRIDGNLTEIRHSDLKFQIEDIVRFLLLSLDITIDDHEAKLLLHRIEGWPAGMRLISISVNEGESLSELIRELSGDSREVKEYLLNEVLAHQPTPIRNTLLKSSILRRFDKGLCDLFCDEGISGDSFIEHVVLSNIFVIKVSPQKDWYRFHHLFQDLLKLTLEQRFKKEEIEKLHRIAAGWYEEHGDLEEAIFHYTEIGDEQGIVNVLEAHRHELMNQERWARLDYLVSLLPERIAIASPSILITKAFLAENRFFMRKALQYTDRIEQLCETNKAQISGGILAEKDALLALKYYLQNNPEKSIESGLRAIDTLPERYSSVIGFAHGLTAFSMQIHGDVSQSLDLLLSALQDSIQDKSTLHGRILLTLCFMYWFEGDLENMRHVATRYDDFAERAGLPEALAFSKYFLSIGAYQVNRLPEAEMHLQQSIERADNINITAYAQNAFTLAITQYELGQVDKAMELAEQIVQRSYDLGNTELQMIANSFRVDLEIRQGRKRVAEKWLKQIGTLPLSPVYRMYSPYLTEIRALFVQESDRAYTIANERLNEMITFFKNTHQTPMLIELYTLLSHLHEQKGRRHEAEKALLEAISLASPGRFVLVFKSIPQAVPSVLKRLQGEDINPDYYNLLLDAFGSQSQSHIISAPLERPHSKKSGWQPLSNRELDILLRLSKRLSNKEIAAELYISVSTVKRHAVNIYQKLEVHSRREAVDKAHDMGLLS